MSDQRTVTDSRILNRLHGWRLFAARAIWFTLAAACITVFALTQPLTYAGRLEQAYTLFAEALPQLGLSYTFYAGYFSTAGLFFVAINLAIGFFIVFRRSDELIALIGAGLLVFSGVQNLTGYVTLLRDFPQALPILVIVYSVSFGSIMSMVMLFPDGTFYPRWTRWLLLLSLPFVLLDSLTTMNRSVTGSGAGSPFVIVLGILAIVGLIAQRQRYLHALTATQRQQVKWILFGMALTIVPVTLFNIIDPIITPWLIAHPTSRVLYRFAVQLFIFYIPNVFYSVSIAFAIFRYRLWDIDYAINRSIGYVIVTSLLAIIFLILFVVLQNIILNPIALIALAVGAGVIFNPVRRRVQGVVDRRIYHLRFAVDQAADYARSARAEKQAAPRIITLPGAQSGKTLAGYELTDFIGRGGMGEVYKGEVPGGQQAGKTVAVKLLPGMAEDDARMRFVREAEILQRLDHPNVVRVYEYGEEGGLRFMVMDYLDGIPLNKFIHSGEPMNLSTVRKILVDVADALDYIHSQGIIHRDLKPANIMLKLNPDKTVAGAILMDFGVAKSVTTSITGTETIGTIDYMAPEQIQSSGAVDQRADVYALGVMLYEMVTGVRPFQGNVGQVLFAHLRQPAPDPHQYVPTLSAQIAAPMLRALAKLPGERFASAGELAQAMAA